MIGVPRLLSGLPATLALAAVTAAVSANTAKAQNGYYAAIAYSQSTGKIGHTARQARNEQQAQQLALRSCGAPDAKVFTWARDQWVAVAIVEGVTGTAGFARGVTADEAQGKALAECAKRANGRAYRVALCVHSSGMRPRELRSVAAVPAKSKTGYFAAIAYSPTTGKIGQTAGEAKTKEAAHELALKRCEGSDAKVWMWGDGWIAMALAEGSPKAGFAPGLTRKAAEDAAMAECKRLTNGAPCRIAVSIFSAGKRASAADGKGVAQSDGQRAPRPDSAVTQASGAVTDEASQPTGR